MRDAAARYSRFEMEQILKSVRKNLAKLQREEHALNAWSTNSRNSSAHQSKEAQLLKQDVATRKATIRRILQDLHEVNSTHISYSCLDELEILCSLCKEDDKEANDILICDGEGCGRAYHRFCLEPPVLSTPPDEDPWFCHKCLTMRACLALVEEAMDDGKTLSS